MVARQRVEEESHAVRGAQQRVRHAEEEELVVAVADAVVEPVAVMVHLQDARVADLQRTEDNTSIGQLDIGDKRSHTGLFHLLKGSMSGEVPRVEVHPTEKINIILNTHMREHQTST